MLFTIFSGACFLNFCLFWVFLLHFHLLQSPHLVHSLGSQTPAQPQWKWDSTERFTHDLSRKQWARVTKRRPNSPSVCISLCPEIHASNFSAILSLLSQHLHCLLWANILLKTLLNCGLLISDHFSNLLTLLWIQVLFYKCALKLEWSADFIIHIFCCCFSYQWRAGTDPGLGQILLGSRWDFTLAVTHCHFTVWCCLFVSLFVFFLFVFLMFVCLVLWGFCLFCLFYFFCCLFAFYFF